MTKINLFFDDKQNNITKYHDYVIWFCRNIERIFGKKNNGGY